MSGLGFSGEVVDFYHRYRRGYPPSLFDAVCAGFGLTGLDSAVDLGCGTGQLTRPLARRLRVVLGVDPEPDMVAAARRAGTDDNILWALGSDADLPLLAQVLGPGTVGALTVGQALHWMDHDRLFAAARGLLRPGGGVAVVSNGIPLWLQDADWSRRLRGFLGEWLGSPLRNTCGTDAQTRARYAESLRSHGFTGVERRFDHTAPLTVEEIVGGVLSALPVGRLPAAADRPAFAARVAEAVGGDLITEWVPVAAILGRAH